jgi:hypothetical protein
MALQFVVKAVPKSSKQQIVLDKSGMLKCYIKSAPEQGKANQEIIKFLSKQLDIPQVKIEIIKGLSSRIKTISILENITYNQLLEKLSIFVQQPLF